MIPVVSPMIGREEQAAVQRVLESAQLAQGVEVAGFEAEFASLVQQRTCVAVNSGTSALHIALLALGVGPGDEVVVPSFSFAATANAVELCGARAVFADIDPETFCVSPESIAANLSNKTKAIIPVHLFGQPARMPDICTLAQDKNLFVVEDAAQAHGAKLGEIPVGAWGDAAAFSFYPTKNMTSGEGGMVVLADESIARRARMLRNQGMEERYKNELVGLNNRMSELHAAIGRVQLRKLPAWNARRRAIADSYSAELTGIVTPTVLAGATHVFHQYTVRVPGGKRDRFAETLRQRGVESGVYYPTPIHRLPAYNRDVDLPNTKAAAEEVLSIPVHPALSDDDVRQVVACVNQTVQDLL